MHDRTVSTVSIVITRKNRKFSNWLSLYRNLINRTMDIRRVSKPLEPPKLIPSDSFGFTLELILMKRIAIIYCSFFGACVWMFKQKKDSVFAYVFTQIDSHQTCPLSFQHSLKLTIDRLWEKKSEARKIWNTVYVFVRMKERMKISVPDMAANLGHNFPICQNCLVHYRN